MNFYQHHIGDYDSHTAHLSWLEDVAYRRLLCLYYRSEKPLPAPVTEVCRLVRASSRIERAAVEIVLREFFHEEGDGWHNERADIELSKMQAKVVRNREVGKRGGRPRAQTSNPESSNEKPTDNPDGLFSEPKPNPTNTQYPIPNTQEEEVSEPKGSAAGAAQGELIGKPATVQSPLETQDPKDWLFREGLRYLVDSSGKPPDKMRSLLGKWRRDMREDVEALRGLLRLARDQRIAEPVAWVTKAIVERAKAPDVAFAPTDETGWRQRFDAYRETGGWPAHWGGAKPGDDPRHPPELLIKYGFNDAVMPGFLKACEAVAA